MYEPPQLLQVQREESEARLRLEAAREQALMNEGEVPSEHHELIHKLEADWKHALERLHRTRGPRRTDRPNIPIHAIRDLHPAVRPRQPLRR